MLESRQIEMGHARALLSISNPIQQFDAARQVVKKGMSVRDTEQLVRRIIGAQAAPKKSSPAANPGADIRRLETELSEKLGARIRIDHSSKGFGKLIISYNNLDELDGILKHIR
jgi:ParB family chromosome partitioning protein